MISDRIARFVIAVFSRTGTITLATPDGRQRAHGSGAPDAEMTILGRAAYGRVVRHGALGLAEAYLEGEIQTDGLQAMLTWAAENHVRRGSGRPAAIGSPSGACGNASPRTADTSVCTRWWTTTTSAMTSTPPGSMPP